MLPRMLPRYPTGRRDLTESATRRMTGEIRRGRQKLYMLKELRQTRPEFSCAEQRRGQVHATAREPESRIR